MTSLTSDAQVPATGLAAPSLPPSLDDGLVMRVRGGKHDDRIVRLTRRKCSIGAHQACTLRLVSRRFRPVHCYILRGQRGTVVRRWDDDTLLNGQHFSDAWLQPGDRLSVGPLELEIIADGPKTDSAAGPRHSTFHTPPISTTVAQRRDVRSHYRQRVVRLCQRMRAAKERLAGLQLETDRREDRIGSLTDRITELEAELEFQRSAHAELERQLQQSASIPPPEPPAATVDDGAERGQSMRSKDLSPFTREEGKKADETAPLRHSAPSNAEATEPLQSNEVPSGLTDTNAILAKYAPHLYAAAKAGNDQPHDPRQWNGPATHHDAAIESADDTLSLEPQHNPRTPASSETQAAELDGDDGPNGEEDGIQDYMSSLMRRLGSEGDYGVNESNHDNSAARRSDAETRSASTSAATDDSVQGSSDLAEEPVARSKLPAIDLEAMRDVANANARLNISRHRNRVSIQEALLNGSLAAGAFIIAGGLMYWSERIWSLKFAEALLAVCCGLYWGFRSVSVITFLTRDDLASRQTAGR